MTTHERLVKEQQDKLAAAKAKEEVKSTEGSNNGTRKPKPRTGTRSKKS